MKSRIGQIHDSDRGLAIANADFLSSAVASEPFATFESLVRIVLSRDYSLNVTWLR